MIFQRALEFEADRLGMRVTPEEQTQRIKEMLPTAWSGSTWLKDRYRDAKSEAKFGMTVEQFEGLLRDDMLTEKFHEMVTDGITVSPQEVAQEFLWRNEKVKIDYVLIKPADLAASHPSERRRSCRLVRQEFLALSDSRAPFRPLRPARSLQAARRHSGQRRYACAPITTSTSTSTKSKTARTSSTSLFKTIGKTDAEIAEIRQKAEDVLKQAKHGANFEDLAKKYSEDDATKPKGGDLGWIVDGQTVPEFQQAAFSLPKGSISDLVKTQYGFHIIKVLDRETAHTKTLRGSPRLHPPAGSRSESERRGQRYLEPDGRRRPAVRPPVARRSRQEIQSRRR